MTRGACPTDWANQVPPSQLLPDVICKLRVRLWEWYTHLKTRWCQFLLFIERLLCWVLNRHELAGTTEVAAIYNPYFLDEETPESLVSAQSHSHLPVGPAAELRHHTASLRDLLATGSLTRSCSSLCFTVLIHKTGITVALHGVDRVK